MIEGQTGKNKNMKIDGEFLNNLFASDIFFVYTGAPFELQHKLQELPDESKMGVKMNIANT